MQAVPLLDRAGRRRSPATTSSFHQGVPPRNKGLRYPPDPPTVDEIIAVMRAAGAGPEGVRLRGVIVVLWRAGLQDQRGARAQRDRPRRRSRRVHRPPLAPATSAARLEWTDGRGRTSNRGSSSEAACRSAGCSASCAGRPRGGRARRPESGPNCTRLRVAAGMRSRFAPHQLRHAHAVEMSREGISLIVNPSANSATPISRSPPGISAESTTRRSSQASISVPKPMIPANRQLALGR